MVMVTATRTAKTHYIGLAKQRLCTCITLFSISLLSLHDYNVKMPNFTFCGGMNRRQQLSFSFPVL